MVILVKQYWDLRRRGIRQAGQDRARRQSKNVVLGGDKLSQILEHELHQSGSHLEAIFFPLCPSFIDQVWPPQPLGYGEQSQLLLGQGQFSKGEVLSYYQLTLGAPGKAIWAGQHLLHTCIHMYTYVCTHMNTHAHVHTCAHVNKHMEVGKRHKIDKMVTSRTELRLRGVVKVSFSFIYFLNNDNMLCNQ